MPAPHQLYGSPPVVTAANGAAANGAPEPVTGGPVPVPWADVVKPPASTVRADAAQPTAGPPADGQVDAEPAPAKTTARRAAARTPRARKAVEPLSGEGAGTHGGGGSAA